MIKRRHSLWMSLFLSLVLVLGVFLPAAQVQGTDVNNSVNYSADVIYQIVTDRFHDGNPSNNPTGNLFSANCSNFKKYCGGDWQGIINKIQDGYLTNMGVTALWISQPVENVFAVMNDKDGSTSYHGYWARDFKKPNPFFGNMNDFDRLIQVAHAHGLKVIIDFAPNHTSPASSDEPSYMENGKLYDNGTLLGGYTNDHKNLFQHYGGTDFSSIEDGIYRNLYDLADLNLQNPQVDKYLRDAIKLWLDKGIDGIRMDAVKHMPFGWQKTFMDTIYNHRPVFTFGEWFLGKNEIDPANYAFANESGMSLLDFEYGQKMIQVLRDGTDNWVGFHNMIQRTESAYEQVNDQVTFIDNHDMDRFTKVNGNTRNTDMALAVLLTSRGVPTIYYGTEQYMTGNGDPANRQMMTSFNTNTRAYQIIQALAPLRKANPALAYGTTQERWISPDVYIYERKFGNNVAVVAINKNLSQAANISSFVTSLPSGTYQDALSGLLNGQSLTVNSSGSTQAFTLKAGEVAVWHYTQASSSTPLIGHVGTMMGRAGQTVTIDGVGFGTSNGTVRFGTTAAPILSWNDKQIKVRVPNIATGKYHVSVTRSNGVKSNEYKNFEVLTKQVSVRFIVHNAQTNLGQGVYIVGSVPELGSWDPAKAVGPFYNQVVFKYPSWYMDLSVPAGQTIQFKYIKKDSQGNVVWESGNNHSFTTPADGPGTVEKNWSN
ncbi:alpha-amylase family glycosyl hydrolase [Caldalkalibacillus mannanilyticus]|uniref:alpha-amylase family glycosyl hydrolase n=1 Tax=Caldalkalibacillus mannanilyticus TaxID=1418 RepID=UPI000B205500|nr:alpha-amylase family glycosyl hydrolase [Caldalkalibacillus mannanilyticus]